MRLGAVDPGKHHAGLSLFVDGVLVAAMLVVSEELDPGHCAKDLGQQAAKFFGVLDRLAYEFPRVYPKRHTDADPNDLLYLCFTNGAINHAVTARERELIEPHAWKGNIDPEIVLERIYDRLSPAEQLLVPKLKKKRTPEHNVLDSCGLGLYSLMRM